MVEEAAIRLENEKGWVSYDPFPIQALTEEGIPIQSYCTKNRRTTRHKDAAPLPCRSDYKTPDAPSLPKSNSRS